MHEAQSIPARVVLDADALAALRGAGPSAEVAGLLRDVKAMLERLDRRLTDATKLALSETEAAEMTGLCSRTLRQHGCPCVRVGSRIVFPAEGVRRWLEERQAKEKSESSGPCAA